MPTWPLPGDGRFPGSEGVFRCSRLFWGLSQCCGRQRRMRLGLCVPRGLYTVGWGGWGWSSSPLPQSWLRAAPQHPTSSPCRGAGMLIHGNWMGGWVGDSEGSLGGGENASLVKDHCLSLYTIPKPSCYLIPSCTSFRPIPIHMDLIYGAVWMWQDQTRHVVALFLITAFTHALSKVFFSQIIFLADSKFSGQIP